MRTLQTWLFGLLCAVSAAVYNPQIYKLDALGIGWDVVVVVALHGALAMLFGRIPGVRWAYFTLMNLAGCATTYFYTVFGVTVNYDSVAWLFETNSMEVNSFLTWRLSLLMGVSFLLGLIQASLSKRVLGDVPLKRYAAVFGVALLAVAGLYKGSWAFFKYMDWQPTYEAISLSRVSPISIPKAIRMYIHEEGESEKLLDLPNPADAPSQLVVAEDERPTVVFIIGESAQAAHFGINGYERQTTPRLAAMPNLLNYGVCRSFGNTTRVSLIGMLTDARIKERKPQHASFINLFNKHGYETYFISRQNKLGRSGHLTDALISCSKHVKYVKGRDIELVRHMNEAIGDTSGNLVLLHMVGSHFSYKHQYTDQYRKFVPDDYVNEELSKYHQNVINAYDNSILKTDDMIASVIDALRDKNAVVFYTSDHGDSLGKRGVFLHGTTVEQEQYEVPFLLWYSDAFKAARPQTVAHMQAAVGTPVTHDFIYHTLAGLAGIRSDVLDASLDLSGTMQSGVAEVAQPEAAAAVQ